MAERVQALEMLASMAEEAAEQASPAEREAYERVAAVWRGLADARRMVLAERAQ